VRQRDLQLIRQRPQHPRRPSRPVRRDQSHPTVARATPISYRSDGTQCVVVVAGGGDLFGAATTWSRSRCR